MGCIFKKIVVTIIFFCITLTGFSKGKLVAGPMQGATTPTGIKIWLMVKNADSVTFTLIDSTNSILAQSLTLATKSIESFKGNTPLTFVFSELKENKAYKYEIVIDGNSIKGNRTLKTSSSNAKDFSFLLFSCALTPPFGLRFIHPGIENRTYKHIAKKGSEFTLWIGDYLYYMKKDSKSKEGMLRKQTRNRKLNKIDEFLQTQPQYSIWDDHDFGPNNCGKDYPLCNQSLEVFKQFWPNPAYGTAAAQGCFFDFSYGDADFFMLDTRTYLTKPAAPSASYLGNEQLEWLKQKLLASKAAFKFIASGSQVLNVISRHECYYHYKDEFNDLLSFIEKHNIAGVVFLSGDRHHSELMKMERDSSYALYDFTSSPVTSFRNRLKRSPELNNPNRVPGTLVPYQNFGRITLSGESADRVCKLEIFNNRGKPVWNYSIKSSDLAR